ncbi:MAG: alpha-amylase family glycosyl hydrolase [Actinomycetota bacterium]
MAGDWLADAVMYEIYPQSFADSNGDGIGDLRGVIDRLDHLSWLGVNTIWFNPCFSSPFADAGYDVSDYLSIAPRYGTNADLVELVGKARERGIRVILDLVVGHTSVEHPWFQEELNAIGPHPGGDRYVWCENPPYRDTSKDLPGVAAWVKSPGPRPGWYLKNFYDSQPALNFGWSQLPADEPWRDAVDSAGPQRNRASLKEILSFWFDRGVAGFRVDMAFSLVKDDPGFLQTVGVWQEIRTWLDEAYPDAVLIPEGSEPRTGTTLAFDADFFLVIEAAHASLFDNHAAGRLPFHEPRSPLFDADGAGTMEVFLTAWAKARDVDPNRLIILATADHDFNRFSTGPRTPQQLGAALTFILTWGSVPCIYYGDEIGMRYLPDMPNVEGAICNPLYNRAGCRTPMQWDNTRNAGFSTADPADLYLPIDPDPNRPTVAGHLADPSSTMQLVRELIALRQGTPALGTRASTRIVHAGYPLVYLRGETHLVVLNPSRESATLSIAEARSAKTLLSQGFSLTEDTVVVDAFGYAILEVAAFSPLLPFTPTPS